MALEYKQIVVKDYTEDQLRDLWRQEYCRQEIYTHDGVRVKFYDSNFDHAFYESSVRKQSGHKQGHKDVLSPVRLSRMLWIKDALADGRIVPAGHGEGRIPELLRRYAAIGGDAVMYDGYESKKKKHNPNKRVSVVKGNYVVVIELQKQGHATFITAYVADNSIEKIKQSPKWTSWEK